MISLPEEFKFAMQNLLQDQYEAFLASYEQKPKKALRVNTLKIDKDTLLAAVPKDWRLAPSKLSPQGFLMSGGTETEAAGKHPLHMAGAYYIQEPSAMSVAATLYEVCSQLNISLDSPNRRILDMCAAPGGKTGATAAYMNGNGIIVANETVNSRAFELAKNVERLGISNAVVINAHPQKIAETLPDYFDIVIVDAPCSGEGMFRKNPSAALFWSKEHVLSCATRQNAILQAASRALRFNGLIVYSTCTFSVEENEGVTETFAQENGFEILHTKRLFPHSCEGEGHFVCVMQKKQDNFEPTVNSPKKEKKTAYKKPAYSECTQNCYLDFLNSAFIEPPALKSYILNSGKVLLCDTEMLKIASALPTVSCGIHGGYIKGYFEPSHSLFMACHGGKYRLCADFAPDSAELAHFLRGESIASPITEKGFCAVTTCGLPIGFAKLVDGTLKNKLPKGLRRTGG